ncbi:beta-ketoacyl synthase N-terminal-like domain-containing protein [Plantactinospora sp. WMMB334]|uniref:beta-ketoacyl synthase N-terminal-like domain-containing protein n=1 Tax=Plantactinospora sp. WMMB334 TaxID=3404119 RepID=UPI003B951B1E
MPSAGDRLAVRGLGLRLPGLAGAADLARLVGGADLPPPSARRFVAPETDLEPVDRRAAGPVEPRIPAAVAGRGLRALPAESLLALAASAVAAGTGDPPDPVAVAAPADAAPAAVLWASSSAGLAEYATICVEAATLDPGLSSPIIGPASAFNGPAATVSIRLGLDGPNETLTGGTTAGVSALVEAARLVAGGEAARALVGGSATVSRWSLTGLAEEFVAGEGAACLAVSPCRDEDEPGIRLGRFRRLTLDRADLAAQCRALAHSASAEGQSTAAAPGAAKPGAAGPATPGRGPVAAERGPVAAIVSTVDSGLVGAVAEGVAGPVWHLERSLGDFGAAGGLLAAASAVAYCASAGEPASVLVLAIEPSGNAAILEVFAWGAPTSSSGWWGEHSHRVGVSGSPI